MTILLSFLCGIIPAVIWLMFWLREDKINPEPKKYILFSFLTGMLAALIVLGFQTIIIEHVESYTFLCVILLASAEEIFKFIAAYMMALKREFMNEPIDAIIYMITIALGFAALENSLYIYDAVNTNGVLQGILVSNMRFIGSAILHTAASGIIGVAIALSFYKKASQKLSYLIVGIISAIILHTGFNLFIINNVGGGILGSFTFIWGTAIIILFLFEKIKQLKPENKQY